MINHPIHRYSKKIMTVYQDDDILINNFGFNHSQLCDGAYISILFVLG